MSGKVKFLIAAVLVLISAAALTLVNSRVTINYCKGTVKLDDGFAVLKETDSYASVIKLDNSGRVMDRTNILLNDPFTLSVKSVHNLFTDDRNNLYVLCSVYGPKRSVYETMYKCDFLVGGMKKIWSAKQIDDHTVIPNCTPYVDGKDIYIPMLNQNGKVDIVKFSDAGHTVVISDCDLGDGIDAEKIFYRDGVVFSAESTVGIFANGEKIYPRDDAEHIQTALNYEDGILSFVDISENKLLHYDVSAGTFSEETAQLVSLDELQCMHAYSDGTVTAAREDGEYLRAYRYSGGAEETYSLVKGGFSFRAFLVFTVVSAAAAALIALVNMLLFVRIRRQKKGGVRKYQSIAARITAISTAAGIVCGIVFGIVIYGTVKRLNSSLQNSIDTSGSQFLANYIFTDCQIELKNGVPTLSEHSGENLKNTMENYQSALAENNSTVDCDFLLFAESGGKLYQLGSRYNDTVPAEYSVSIRVVGMIKNSIDTEVNCSFEDRMTSGRLKYTCTNFPIYGTDNMVYDGVLCAVTDAYSIRQTAFSLYLWLIAVIFGLVVLMLIAANIVLHCNLSGLKRLKKAFALYENGGEPSVFLLSGKNGNFSDEITETGQALMLMTEGTRVHARDISEGNRKYKRFMAAGILKMMDRSEISKVNFGDRVSESALIIRFIIENGSDISERAKLINGFIEMSGGVLLNFGGGKADVCFTDEEEFCRAADMAARLGYPSAILASFGTVQAGNAGNDSSAWLIALSEEFAEFEKIRRFANFSDGMICTKKLAEKLEREEFLARCELRAEMLGDIEFFDIIPRELEPV